MILSFSIISLLVSLFFSCTPVFADEKITINEFMAHPSGDSKEWVEVYVPDKMDCTGYWIDDDESFDSDGGSGKKYKIEQCIVYSTNRFSVIELPTALLNNDEDSIVLFDTIGTKIDQYTYASDPGVDITIGRNPDRNGSFYTLLSETKGSINSLPIPTSTPTPTPTAKPTREPTTEPSPRINTPIPTMLPIIDESGFHISPIQQVKGISSSNKQPVKKSIATNGAYPTLVLPPEETGIPTRIQPSPTGIVMVKSAAKSGPFFIILGGFSLISCAILMVRKR